MVDNGNTSVDLGRGQNAWSKFLVINILPKESMIMYVPPKISMLLLPRSMCY